MYPAQGVRKTARMYYLDFLEGMHERLRPRTYLEIGVRRGHSLALARCRSIGIDPVLQVDQPISRRARLIEATSDAYFARLGDAKPFGRRPIDFAFVDGMHLCEFALRDFAYIERLTRPGSVVAFDDIFPRNGDEAARTRHTEAWTGDVFRAMLALEEHRKDLRFLRVNTEPTGMLLVYGFRRSSHFTAARAEELAAEFMRPDPQVVPQSILNRESAVEPEVALSDGIWSQLRGARRRIW